MDFISCLNAHFAQHPAMQPRDVIKLCYQAAFGGEHLLTDVSGAVSYFNTEYETVTPSNEPLYEELSPTVARISFKAWKRRNLPAAWLLRMFLHSAALPQAGKGFFEEYLSIAGDEIHAGHANFPFDAWTEALASYEGGAVHHSEEYRRAEAPAYRIVSSRFLPLLPLLEKLAALPVTDRARVIAIDGRAASGKSSAAELLETVLEAGIIHMDDFFLPPELRTAERLAESGGNVHYERFMEEVLPHLGSAAAFSYPRFDCSVMQLRGAREVAASPFRIVEGSYSHHPALGDYADLRVFSHVSPKVQQQRILRRNGEDMLQMFLSRWIPMEERYFADCGIQDTADLIIRNDQ